MESTESKGQQDGRATNEKDRVERARRWALLVGAVLWAAKKLSDFFGQ